MLHICSAIVATKAAACVVDQRRSTNRISSEVSRKPKSIPFAKHKQQCGTVYLCIRRLRTPRRWNCHSTVSFLHLRNLFLIQRVWFRKQWIKTGATESYYIWIMFTEQYWYIHKHINRYGISALKNAITWVTLHKCAFNSTFAVDWTTVSNSQSWRKLIFSTAVLRRIFCICTKSNLCRLNWQ